MTLDDICILKTDFPEADFWIERKGSENKVGKPTKSFSDEDIGVKVRDEFRDRVDPLFLYYYFMHLQQKGIFIEMSHGTLRLKHIRLSDIKSIPISFRDEVSESVLLEQVSGLDEIIEQIKEKFPQTEEHVDKIREFITNSGCQKITVEDFMGFKASGLSLHDRVVINSVVFESSIENFFYILFHEIAHQYQYKKYGKDFAYKIYLGKIHIEDGVQMIKNTETIADEFAIRKCREFVKIGLLDKNKIRKHGVYKNTPIKHFYSLLSDWSKLLREKNVTDSEDVSEIIYNYIIKTQEN